MRAVTRVVKTDIADPLMDDPGVLTGRQMQGRMDPAREQEIAGVQRRTDDPVGE